MGCPIAPSINHAINASNATTITRMARLHDTRIAQPLEQGTTTVVVNEVYWHGKPGPAVDCPCHIHMLGYAEVFGEQRAVCLTCWRLLLPVDTED